MKSLSIGFVLLALTTLTFSAQAPSLSGDWKVYSNIMGYETNLDCRWVQDGQDLSGTCKYGEAELKLQGRVEGESVSFQYQAEYEGQDLTVIHKGSIASATRVTGTVEVLPMGVTGDFAATQSR